MALNKKIIEYSPETSRTTDSFTVLSLFFVLLVHIHIPPLDDATDHVSWEFIMTAGDASQARRQESSSTAPCCWHCRFEELLVESGVQSFLPQLSGGPPRGTLTPKEGRKDTSTTDCKY
jgi:hypothetical protein